MRAFGQLEFARGGGRRVSVVRLRTKSLSRYLRRVSVVRSQTGRGYAADN